MGQPKATVAAAAVRALQPHARVTGLHANIKESRFNVSWFKSFHLVLNGLDNVDARRHVNRLCLAAGVPLLESGTAGYGGQVTVHLKNVTKCYECDPKVVPKTFPVCTIRNTPDRPIHCVTWSKDLLFPRLFGPPDAVTDLDEEEQDNKKEEDRGNNTAPTSTTNNNAPSTTSTSFFHRRPDEAPRDYAVRIFTRVFQEDIERVLRMDDLWKKHAKKPNPLRLTDLLSPTDLDNFVATTTSAASSSTSPLPLDVTDRHQPWSTRDAAGVFVSTTVRFLTQRSSEVGTCVFDKDDGLAVDFVAAASHLRSACYDIPPLSPFACKGMAGNIIHAIATTNAMVAGLMVIEAVRLLAWSRSVQQTHGSWLTPSTEQHPRKRIKFLVAVAPEPPNPDCVACGSAEVLLKLDTSRMTLRTVVEQVIKKRLGVSRATVDCADTDLVYEEGSDLDEDEVEAYTRNLDKVLERLPGKGVCDGAVLAVSDALQDIEVRVRIEHAELDEAEVPEGFVLTGGAGGGKKRGGGGEPPGPSAKRAKLEEEDLVVL